MLPIIPIVAAVASVAYLVRRRLNAKNVEHARLIRYVKAQNVYVDDNGKFNPDAVMSDGVPLLYSAMYDVKVLTNLLEYGANPNVCNSAGIPAIVFASGQKQLEGAVYVLLKHGANPNAMDPDGKTALFYASTKSVRRMLLNAGSDINAADITGKTVLFYAQTPNDVELFCNAGGNINAADVTGKTAIFYFLGNAEMLGAFIECGADIHVKDCNGKGIMEHVTWRDGFQSILILERSGLSVDALGDMKKRQYEEFKRTRCRLEDENLLEAVKNNDVKKARRAIWSGANPNLYVPNEFRSLIYIAVSNDNPEMIENLVKAGADIDGNGGPIPLQKAVFMNSFKSFQMLLKLGANPKYARHCVLLAGTEEMKQLFEKYDKQD